MKKILIFLSACFFFETAQADIPQLYNLTSSDVALISKEFAADFVHTINAPASSYGHLFGFEVGFLGGMTKSPNIDRVSKSIDSNASIAAIPTAGLIVGASGPLGFGGEASFIPKVTSGGFSIQDTSMAFKWTCTDLIPNAPMNLAIRVHGSVSKLGYTSLVQNASTGNLPVSTNVMWKNTSSGYNVELSKKLLFIEPYIGFGAVSTKTDIGVAAASTVQIFSFTTATNFISNNSGSHYYGGMNVNLFIFKVGAEYARIMGVTKITAKTSFYF